MDKTSWNAKHGMESFSSFQSVLAHDLAYWPPFSLQVPLMKHIFVLDFTPCKAEQPLQGIELQEKEAQKD